MATQIKKEDIIDTVTVNELMECASRITECYNRLKKTRMEYIAITVVSELDKALKNDYGISFKG